MIIIGVNFHPRVSANSFSGLYSEKLQPLIAKLSGPAIAKSLGVTRAYAGRIRRGVCRPHPRHWQALADLVHVGEGRNAGQGVSDI
jgi:hypothetical protein